jgi:flavin-dependent dehydrogenase
MIVGADGTTGPVSQTIKGIHAPRRISRTLETWSPVTLTSPLFSQQSARFDFDFLSQNLQGYYWEFPSIVQGEIGHNHGVYDSRLAKTRSRSDLPAVLKRAASPVLSQERLENFQGAPIHWFNPANKIADHRVILVGDAAGVEVLFGEGISPALYYGKIAARAITAAFQEQDFEFSAYRQQIMTSRLGWYLFIRWLLASYLYNLGHLPFFSHLFWTVGQILATIWRGYRLF